MTPVVPTYKRRAAAALFAAAIAVAPFAVVSSATSAAPAGDCAAAFPVTDLTAGLSVTGLAVTSGTTPTGFTGTILGVLKDGIAPGVDMVLARLSSPEIDRVGGIWKGISGSPVYAPDGRLIGAVAYGLSGGSSPVAGITPYTAMSATTAARHAAIPPTLARKLAAAGVTARQARSGMEQLEVPLAVSGVSARTIRKQPDRSWLPERRRCRRCFCCRRSPG